MQTSGWPGTDVIQDIAVHALMMNLLLTTEGDKKYEHFIRN